LNDLSADVVSGYVPSQLRSQLTVGTSDDRP